MQNYKPSDKLNNLIIDLKGIDFLHARGIMYVYNQYTSCIGDDNVANIAKKRHGFKVA